MRTKMTDVKEKVNQLSMMEQSLQQFLHKKQGFQSQLLEVESALKEITNTEKTYKIVGNVMVESNKETLLKDLEEKKETLSLRLKTLEKQEEKMRTQTQELQSEVMKEMAKNG